MDVATLVAICVSVVVLLWILRFLTSDCDMVSASSQGGLAPLDAPSRR
jgi:hypothetical protein